jgi:phosphoglycolate phosphatase-like HAD superfamily hydrolase
MFAKPASIEIASPLPVRPSISHVIFDFDGTLSWLRHGWPRVMFEVFRPHYPVLTGETEPQIFDLLMSEILSLNGKPSIFQMFAFHTRALARGGKCPSPEELLHEYQSRLDALIAERTGQIKRGETAQDEFVIFGARTFLEKLRRRGIQLVILSGTIHHRVEEEAQLLKLSDYFGRHIYGSTPDSSAFSKKEVIARLLREEKIKGEHLLSFGDGPVEMRETKNVGGLAIAVASDEEHNGSGRIDPWKRQQLIEAGADAVMPDYRDAAQLLEFLKGKQDG